MLMAMGTLFNASNFAQDTGVISLQNKCIQNILRCPDLVDQYQDLRHKEGEKRASQRIIRSLKGITTPLDPPLFPPLGYCVEKEAVIEDYSFDLDQSDTDKMRAFSQAIDRSIDIDPKEAIMTCIGIGPERAAPLFEKIIQKYPAYHRAIFTYLKNPALYSQSVMFTMDLKLRSVDESDGMTLIKFLGDQGYAPAKAHHVAYCLKKSAIEEEEKKELLKEAADEQRRCRAIEAAEKKKALKLEALRQQSIRDQACFDKVRALIEKNKLNEADHILFDLAERGDKEAIIERGKIQQGLMFKSIVKQAAAEYTQARPVATKGRKKKKGATERSEGDYRRAALSFFESAGTYGHYYVGKFHATIWKFLEDTHQAMAEKARKEIEQMKHIESQPKLIAEGLDCERQAIAIWYNNPGDEQIDEARDLVKKATSYYKTAVRLGDINGWHRRADFYQKLHQAKGAYLQQKNKKSIERCSSG